MTKSRGGSVDARRPGYAPRHPSSLTDGGANRLLSKIRDANTSIRSRGERQRKRTVCLKLARVEPLFEQFETVNSWRLRGCPISLRKGSIK